MYLTVQTILRQLNLIRNFRKKYFTYYFGSIYLSDTTFGVQNLIFLFVKPFIRKADHGDPLVQVFKKKTDRADVVVLRY